MCLIMELIVTSVLAIILNLHCFSVSLATVSAITILAEPDNIKNIYDLREAYSFHG